jgi:O-antigen/teichoic acid export membrane protein
MSTQTPPPSQPAPGASPPDGTNAAADRAIAADLTRRAKFAAVALTIRAIVLQLTVLVGGVALRRILAVADFGAIAIAQVALQFFILFGDAGLGGALIQKKGQPTQRELSSVWCLQVVLASAFIIVVWFAAPLLVRFWPDLQPSAVWLFRALSVELLLTAMRVVPTVLMERELQYGRLSVLEVLLVIPYYLVAIAFAHAGFGVYALAFAVLAQGLFGVIGAFLMRPWRPSLSIDMSSLRPILRFGITYQMKNVVGVIMGAITPVYAGRALGQTTLGLINFGIDTAYFPLRLVEIISRVSFPLFSRMQHDKQLLARALERSVQLCSVATLFYVGLMLGLAPNVVLIVYGAKWLPAVPVLYVFLVAIAFGFLAPLIVPALDATGNPHLSLRLSMGWTAAMIVLVPLVTPFFGAVGYAVAYSIPTVIGNLVMIVVLKRLVPEARFWRRTRAAIVGAVAIALTGWLWLSPWAVATGGWHGFSPWVVGVVRLVVSIITMSGLFALIAFAMDRRLLQDAAAMLRKPKPTG